MLHTVSDEVEKLAGMIGDRVRHERGKRGWTLEQLAEIAGVSRRMVISVEQGAVNPSIGTLLRLSDALGVGLSALVDSPPAGRSKVTTAGNGAVLWRGAHGGTGVLVASTEPPDVVELWDWTLAPGDEHTSETHSEGTRELLQVHDGELTMTVDGQISQLASGDAMTFASDVPHSYANHGVTPTVFTLSVFEPGVIPGHRRGGLSV